MSGHLSRASENGCPVELTELLNEATLTQLRQFCHSHADESTASLLTSLPPEITPGELMLFLKVTKQVGCSL